MQNSCIRSATEEDKQGIADLIVPIQREEFGVQITYKEQPDLVEIKKFYQYGLGGFWVAIEDGDVVGSIALKDIGNQQTALRKMFVKPEFRGKPHRTAQKLLEHLLQYARNKGVKEIFLGTTPMYLAAHRFYEKNGFELLDKTDLPKAFPVMEVDKRFYKMDLTNDT